MLAVTLATLALANDAAGSRVYTFSITGGPCAGKTSALKHLLDQQLEAFPSFAVDVVPEAATLYHQYGARLPFGQPVSTCGKFTESGRNLLCASATCTCHW